MTGDIVNLRRERKRRSRTEAARSAEINRQAFGRSKAEKALSGAERVLAERRLDEHRLDRPVEESRKPAGDA